MDIDLKEEIRKEVPVRPDRRETEYLQGDGK